MSKYVTFSHIYLALFIQASLYYVFGSAWLGAFTASAFFISREYTQAEYRWIESYGQGKRANMPWWGPFDLRVWKKLDAWLDWILPCVVTIIVGYFVRT